MCLLNLILHKFVKNLLKFALDAWIDTNFVFFRDFKSIAV